MWDISEPAPAPAERGFLIRDLLRFFVVDVIIILILRLLLGLGVFSVLDHYVLAVLGGKAVLFLYLLWLIRERRGAWAQTGAATAGVWWAWPLSLVIYAGSYPFLIWADRLNRYLVRVASEWAGLEYEHAHQEVMFLIFGDFVDPPVRMLLVFFAVFAGPFMEELAFRGMGLDAFRRRFGTAWAVVWTSLFFGMYHFSLQIVLSLSLIGGVFAAARLLSRSLWCSIFVHCLHNMGVLCIMAYNLGVIEKMKFW